MKKDVVLNEIKDELNLKEKIVVIVFKKHIIRYIN